MAAVKTEAVVFDTKYQQEVKALDLKADEQQAIKHAFTATKPVFQLLSTIRSRRFGMGYRYETGEAETLPWSGNRTVTTEKGPLAYKSSFEPHPLTELEEALVAWAACGPNGVIAADLPVTGNMNTWLCWAGRTIPAPCNDLAVDVFIVNDEGTWLYRPVAERAAPVEIRSEEDHWKVLNWYREGRVKISDQRLDIGAELGPGLANLTGPWQYNVNRPGSTWFIPVADLGFEWFNLMLPFYEYDHMYLTDPETGEPCGVGEWIKPGKLEVGVPVTLYDQLLLMATPGHQVGCLVQNLRLAAEALGLGAWVFCGTFSDLILGGFPDIAKGLGCKYIERDPARNPNKVMTSYGLPGVKEAVVVPSPQFPTAESVMKYVYEVRYQRGAHFSKEDNWALRNKAPYKAEVMKEILNHPKIKYEDWTYQAVLKTVEYIVDKWQVCPAFVDPLQAQFTAQVHHLDLDFYRKFHMTTPGDQEPFMITNQIKDHFKTWHPGDPDPYS
jgi:hypothetical protein